MRYKGARPEAIDLINKMLQYNPFFRISVENALEHPYFADCRVTSSEKATAKPISL
jgi:serine/threonine protein kinase